MLVGMGDYIVFHVPTPLRFPHYRTTVFPRVLRFLWLLRFLRFQRFQQNLQCLADSGTARLREIFQHRRACRRIGYQPSP